jgi:hypothetical protein
MRACGRLLGVPNNYGFWSIILVAKSFVCLIPLGCPEIRLHFERRKAVESSFRGSPATFQTREPFGQNFWQLLYTGISWNHRHEPPTHGDQTPAPHCSRMQVIWCKVERLSVLQWAFTKNRHSAEEAVAFITNAATRRGVWGEFVAVCSYQVGEEWEGILFLKDARSFCGQYTGASRE